MERKRDQDNDKGKRDERKFYHSRERTRKKKKKKKEYFECPELIKRHYQLRVIETALTASPATSCC